MELIELANKVLKLEMFPYFEIAHVIMVCLSVKSDFGHGINEKGAVIFSRRHPLACWLSCMFSTFSGTILANFLLNEPIVGAFKNTQQVLLASAVWYLMFYSPFDLVYKLCNFLPFKLLVACMKEVNRCHKIHHGVLHASKIYPSSYFIIVLIGTVKGNGAGLMKVMERMFRGIWQPNTIEFIQPTFATKASIAASILFIVDKKTDFISAPHSLVYFGVVIFLVYFKLSSVLLGINDPFGPFENLFCAMFFGGIWDALEQTITSAPQGSRPSSKDSHSKLSETRNGKDKGGKTKSD
jgi:hypothetical protein